MASIDLPASLFDLLVQVDKLLEMTHQLEESLLKATCQIE